MGTSMNGFITPTTRMRDSTTRQDASFGPKVGFFLILWVFYILTNVFTNHRLKTRLQRISSPG